MQDRRAHASERLGRVAVVQVKDGARVLRGQRREPAREHFGPAPAEARHEVGPRPRLPVRRQLRRAPPRARDQARHRVVLEETAAVAERGSSAFQHRGLTVGLNQHRCALYHRSARRRGSRARGDWPNRMSSRRRGNGPARHGTGRGDAASRQRCFVVRRARKVSQASGGQRAELAFVVHRGPAVS